MKLVAVTSCPTGIAHSQMGAENLEQTAERLGHEIKVEIQGAMGAENELTAAEIREADAVIIAADTSVNRDRFAEKPLVKGTIKDAVNDPEGLIEEARATAGVEEEAPEGGAAEAGESSVDTDTAGTDASAATSAGAREESTAATTDRPDGTVQADAPNPDQIGGDPNKGLFARLKRLFS
ncbi:PTS fructose transporter subunit IIB [Haloprofundus salinisoli]|uniref:PTS fructose transporter subunit IIB n=1 Tax=Haloprofundus salinisoli TaxID=2876193 RepID=UPI001CCEC01F|nr:PTS fructose transporter subunit IIB [Haloprofundus salinisoli]